MLRFRIIKVKPGQPTPPPPDLQAPRRRDDREPQDTKVAARAAADAPAVDEALADAARGRAEVAARRGAAAEAPPAEAAACRALPPADRAPPADAPRAAAE